MAAAAALMVGLAPAIASAQDVTVPPVPPGVAADVPVPPGVGAEAVPDVTAQADCTPTTSTYVTHPEWGAVPGACTTGPARSSTDKIFVDSAAGETIYGSNGDLVWFQPPDSALPENLSKGTYQDRPVLSYFQGQGSVVPGSGQGAYVILNQNYEKIATVRMGNGVNADLHEFQILPNGNALMGGYPQASIDASRAGGFPFQPIVDYVVQEVNIATGEVVFDWRASQHVPAEDSFFPKINFVVWDYFHGNSIDKTADGNYLVSGRHTHAVYKIDAKTGNIIWTLGGKRSSFTDLSVAPGSGISASEARKFCWQHDAREQTDGTYTVFDNGNAVGLPAGLQCGPSRGLTLQLTPPSGGAKGTAVITRDYHHDPDLTASFAGSYQPLENGDVFLGYGSMPQAARLAADGSSRLEVALTNNSYRAFTYPWVATPAEAPKAAVADGAVYASWNGATEVASWQLYDGTTAVGPAQPRTGFETRLTVPVGRDAAALTVRPLDASGTPLTPVSSTVTGSTLIQGLAVTAPIGPGSFDGKTLSLPPVNADFLLFGFAPARATFAFDPATAIPVTSSFGADRSTVSFSTKLRAADFSVGGFSLAGLLGPTCESGPITFDLSSTGDASKGAQLSGTYTIPAFTGCAGTDAGLTAVLSRPGNTINLTLPSGQAVTATATG